MEYSMELNWVDSVTNPQTIIINNTPPIIPVTPIVQNIFINKDNNEDNKKNKNEVNKTKKKLQKKIMMKILLKR